MLDSLPPLLRHLILVLIASLLTWAGADLVPYLRDMGGVAAIAGALLTTLVAILTPLTRQYGAFQRKAGPADAKFRR
jgi:hypothetical protein